MSSDTLSHAIPLLRQHTSATLPQLYNHLCTLLTRYTSGLSLPITLDTLPSFTTPVITYHQLRVITTHTTSLHILQSTNSIHHTFFPPSTLPSLPPGTIIRLPQISTTSSDALTLSKSLFPDIEIAHAHLPTLNVLIELPFPKPLPLPHPYQTYTLHNIWNLRDLTPPAVYATLHNISHKRAILTLIDDHHSPPVTFQLLPTRKSILQCLTLPCRLLITAPLVTPSEDGFSLHDTPSSTFFILPIRAKKRPRDTSHPVFSPAQLGDRALKEFGDRITVHARVHSCTVDAGRAVVNIGDVDVVIPECRLEKGDEIILSGVIYGKCWSAERVTNVSIMPGMLYCPFIAKFISIDKAGALCGSGKFLTAFLKVKVTSVETADLVRLKVEDYMEGKDGTCSPSHVSLAKGGDGGGRGVICLKDRGFLQIFGTTKKGFLGMEHDHVCNAVDAIRGVVWRVIVCCGVEDVPVLTACLRGS